MTSKWLSGKNINSEFLSQLLNKTAKSIKYTVKLDRNEINASC